MNRESRKAVLQLLVGLGLLVSGFAWCFELEGGPGPKVNPGWPVLTIPALVSLIALALLRWMLCSRDRAPDYLHAVADGYFEYDGLCFNVLPAMEDELFLLQVFVQNRYANPSQGQIVIRPARGPMIVLPVDCEPGAFMSIAVPYAVHPTLQGQMERFDLAASVTYPRGRGRALRFRSGFPVGHARNESRNRIALTVAAGFAGSAVLTKPASMMLQLPTGTAETVPTPPVFRYQTL